MKHTWHDVEQIARDLFATHPGTDPLGLSLEEIRRLILALPAFGDDPAAVDEEGLEAIQMAWYDLRDA